MLDEIDLKDIVNIVKEASNTILEIYEKNFTIDYKDDESLLTEADLKSNEMINTALNTLYHLVCSQKKK